MPVRVELTDEALDDPKRYAQSGNLARFLKRLLHLEAAGEQAGQPLGGALAGWRKLVVGDRDWRVVYRMNREKTIATVWVIGDRADAACYQEAERRVAAMSGQPPETESLAAAIVAVLAAQRGRRQRGRDNPG
jgi:mRNA interferase RelE/StbE